MNPCEATPKKSAEYKSNLCHLCAPWIKNTAPLDNKERCAIKGLWLRRKRKTNPLNLRHQAVLYPGHLRASALYPGRRCQDW